MNNEEFNELAIYIAEQISPEGHIEDYIEDYDYGMEDGKYISHVYKTKQVVWDDFPKIFSNEELQYNLEKEVEKIYKDNGYFED